MHSSLLEIMIALLVAATLFACSAGEAVDLLHSVHSLDVLSSSPSAKEESPLNKEMLRWLLSSKEGREVSHEELAAFPQYNETWSSLISVGVAQDLPSLSHAASRLASKVLRDETTHLELSCAALQGTFRFVRAATAPSIREAASASKCQLPTSAFDVSSSYWRRGVERHDVSAVIAPLKVSAQAEGSSCEQGATFAEAIAYAKERLRTSFSNVLYCEEETWTEEVRTQHIVAIIQIVSKEGAAPDYLLVIHDSSSQLLLSLAGSSLGKDVTASPTLRLRHIDYTLMVEDMDGNTRSLLVSRSTVASSVASSPSFRLLKSVVLSKGSDSEGGMRRRSSPDILSADRHKNLTVMSYNIWNFNANWEERKVLIANEIMKVEPDIVGVQEIRQRYGTGLSINPSQLEDLAALLPDYHSWIYQPAMRYTNEQEGVGILTRHPILNHSYIDLTFVPGTNDLNQRVVLRALVDSPTGPIQFFVTHFTYAQGRGQMSNALELLRFMHQHSNGSAVAQVAVGDFNVYTGDERPADFLTGKSSFSGQRGDLRDAWEETALPNKTMTKEDVDGVKKSGYTFSNLPNAKLINRADRIYVRREAAASRLSVVETKRIGFVESTGGVPASDHLGLYSLLQIEPADA